ncbi:hypothetical protein NBRC116493_21250 [Aurantivibrio infirmus]
MKTALHSICLTGAALALISPVSFGAESITEVFEESKITLNLRLRFEDVDVDGVNDRDLLSLKTRLTYSTGELKGLSGLLEMDDVTHFSDFEGGVADPEGTEVNQVYLAYKNWDTTFKYGRQRIILDNQRFVGGVGFRQNEQTYDGFSVSNTSIGDTEFFLANIDNVNRIFGESVAIGDHENSTILFNAKYSGLSFGAITAYAYLMDNKDAAGLSNDTYGIRFAGKQDIFSYALEYATQSDADNNPANYDANYTLVEGGAKLGPVNVTLGYEVLGTDGTNGRFITPLATLHAFQGWTDVFLGGGSGNVAGGIEDIYLKAAAKFAGLNFLVIYHQLGADDDSANGGIDDYGSEIGFQVAKSWEHYGLSFKIADYSADDFALDTRKFWLTATAKF